MRALRPPQYTSLLLFLILFFVMLFVYSCAPHLVAPLHAPVGEELGSENDETREARDKWLLFQRQYPFDYIPPDGRLRAWESRPRAQIETEAIETGASVQNWRSIGPNPIMSAEPNNWALTSGRINAVAISPADPQLILIGGADGGIWRSTDGGASFVPVGEQQVDLSVGSIAFSNSDPAIVYAGMGSDFLGTGVLKSIDAGQTWTRVSNSTLPSPGIIPKILVDPTNPNRAYVAQYAKLGSDGNRFSSGFFISTDGGVNWARTKIGLPEDVAIDPANPQTLYLSLSRVDEPGSPPAGLYRSTNGGQTWSFVYSGPFDPSKYPHVRVALTNVSPQSIYALAGGYIGDNYDVRVAASTDGGATWTERAASGLKKSVWDYIAIDPKNANTLYIGVEDLYKSTDAGASWTNMTGNYAPSGDSYKFQPDKSNSHPDHRGSLAFSPVNSNLIYIGTDGGLYKSFDGGGTFQSLNATLSLTQYYSIALHPTNPAISYGGTQDNGNLRRMGTSDQWKEYITGDAGHTVIDPLDPSTIFSTYIFGSINRWRNDANRFDKTIGTNSIFGEPDSNPRISFIPPFTGNSVDATLYFGTWRLFTSTDLGDSWAALSGTMDLTKGITQFGPDALTAVGIGPASPNVIYSGSAQGRVMVSIDGGKSWTDITGALPDRFINSITLDPTNSAIAYLTVSGYRSGHVFQTTNFGGVWTDISGNLPDIPTNALLIDPIIPNVLYVGTDIGNFRSVVGGTAWESFNDGMPPVVVNAFASQASGLVQCATYGRGAFEMIRTGIGGPDFSLGFDQNTVNAEAGTKARVTVNINRTGGFTGNVTVTPPDPAGGIKAKPPDPITTSNASAVFKMKIGGKAATGPHQLTFTATDDSGKVRTAALTIVVR